MKELLSWVWTIWSYGIVFVLVLFAEGWLVVQFLNYIEPKEGFKPDARLAAKVVNLTFVIAIVAIAAWASYAINNAPPSDCGPDYDKQGIHSNC